ncbi:MAG: PA0069 family radical SAM protein [Ignavibacteriales bacterium]|nr:MAG: PA0069 family radical SAM protein [Ignavibacteriales bacterium]
MAEQKIKGRGASFNPQNRFEKLSFEDVSIDEWADPEETGLKNLSTEYFIDNSKTIISKNNSSDVGFDYSFNPYRGCEHGCIYCYARPTHEYLGFSSGVDFETKIMVKPDAAKLLETEFKKKNYKPDVIIFSGNTDCYQPVEKKLKLTRDALKTCLKFGNPASIITKNALIQRDVDILKEMAELELVSVTFSVTTLDKELARKMEPRASSPDMRLKTVKLLADNGISVGVNLAPIIPGLNDKEIPEILKQASERGATHAGYIVLRLPFAVKDLFIDWLKREYPLKASKIINSIRSVRGGKLSSSEWGIRFRGEGEVAETIENLFKISCRKYGLNKRTYNLSNKRFNVPSQNNQLKLFA